VEPLLQRGVQTATPIGGQVLAVGGQGDGNAALESVESYDPATNGGPRPAP
jgi:hypothetical protein